MSYLIDSPEDLDAYTLEDLESFITADEVNGARGRELLINPALELALAYAPVAYVCNRL